MLMLPLPYVVAFSPPTHAHPPTTAPNMNGAYELSKTPGAPSGASFPTNFKDYPGGVESFDVYHGPITTQYSQVWWASTSNPLPDDIMQRFAGSAIAIVGLEMDQVRRTPQGDVSVPINVAYNHHHDTAVVGKGAHLVEVERDDPRLVKAGRKHIRLSGMKAWVAEEHAPSASGLPTSAMFSDGNGGEYRKSNPDPNQVLTRTRTLTRRVPQEFPRLRAAVRADHRVARCARGRADVHRYLEPRRDGSGRRPVRARSVP